MIRARYLGRAIEFELAADILSTTNARNWDQIGKEGAIVEIRTGLNYFLMRGNETGTSERSLRWEGDPLKNAKKETSLWTSNKRA